MSLVMVGVDHNKAGLDVRGLFSFTKKKAEEAYSIIKNIKGISGSVILSTCNRMEWWISTVDGAEVSPAHELCALLELDEVQYSQYLVERRDNEAVSHLFRLASGLESKIVGEDQILTQVGDALQLARASYAADHALEVLFRLAVTAGKRVKTETRLSTADSSVIHTALHMLRREGFGIAGKKCLVIGNGMMGRLSAQALLESGADVTVTVRQYTSGVVDIPRGCKRINYTDRYEFIPGCDLVVSATSSPNYTLSAENLALLEIDHPICLIDLAVPRDIECEAGALPNFELYDIDSFNIDIQSEVLRQNISKAEQILSEEMAEFYNWYEGRDIVPRIQTLKATAARDVNARLSPLYRGLEAEQKETLEREVDGAAQRMMNRLLFGMKSRLSEAVFSECVEAMEFVFENK